jgi:uncharacterized membrane protein YhaH (DUF805 family)
MHPDKHPPERRSWAEEKQKELNEAYEVLKDPIKKQEYDELYYLFKSNNSDSKDNKKSDEKEHKKGTYDNASKKTEADNKNTNNYEKTKYKDNTDNTYKQEDHATDNKETEYKEKNKNNKGNYTYDYNGYNPLKWAWITIKRATDFKGRSGRKEYIMWWIIQYAIVILIGVATDKEVEEIREKITLILFLITLTPTIALVTRRFHDIGGNAWFTLFLYVGIFLYLALPDSSVTDIIKIILAIILSPFVLALLFAKSDKETNKYGPNPNKKNQD